MNNQTIRSCKIIAILSLLLLTACSNSVPQSNKGRIMVLSVSSDGNYAISTDMSRHAVLWNIKDKTYKILDSKVNIYSAYFIKNTHNFMYQDDTNNRVIVKNIAGRTIKSVNPGFPTYGQGITSDLKTYIGIDKNNQIFLIQDNQKQQLLYHYCGPNYHKPAPPQGKPYTCGSFIGDTKLFNLAISPNEKYFINSGFGEVNIWRLSDKYPLIKIEKNNAQTFATISPNNKYIISGDIAAGGLIISMDKSYKAHNFFFLTPKKPEILSFLNATKQNTTDIVSIKFIDKHHIIVIYDSSPYPFNYATLYSINDIKNIRKQHPGWSYGYILNPIKYLNLLTSSKPDQPYPITQSNVRDQAIDTSPSAHILVMAQAHNNGILVYKYNPKTQTLKQIWAPVIKTPWWHIW